MLLQPNDRFFLSTRHRAGPSLYPAGCRAEPSPRCLFYPWFTGCIFSPSQQRELSFGFYYRDGIAFEIAQLPLLQQSNVQ